MIWAKVVSEPIAVDALLQQVEHPTCGATTLFLGCVRSPNHGREVLSVGYDAFEPLAEKEMIRIAEHARDAIEPKLRVAIAHRVGTLRVGEVSVAIAVATPHRDEAYRASRYVIEEIKVRAPIWKKERYVDGETEWLKGHALCGHSATTNPAASSGEIDYSENHHDQHAHS